VKRDDRILLHEWLGAPYASKWGSRLSVQVKVSIPVEVYWDGMMFPDSLGTCGEYQVHAGKLLFTSGSDFGGIPGFFMDWDFPGMDILAAADGIDPPTGIEWRDVLKKLNPKADFKRGEQGRLIRW